MKPSRVVALLVVLALLTVSVVFLAFSYTTRLPTGTRTIPYVFHVAENPGVDAGTDIFRLGAVTPGGGSSRELSIGGVADAVSPSAVTVFVRGEGAEWLSVEPSVIAVPGTVLIRLGVPLSADFGTYRGELLVVPGNQTVNN